MPTLEDLEKMIEEMKTKELGGALELQSFHENKKKVKIVKPILKKVRKGTQKGG
jgi:hypothetical protein